MKTFNMMATCALAASALASMTVTARQMVPNINYERYLAEKESADADAAEWKKQFYDLAKERKYLPDHSEERGAFDEDSFISQRLYVAKEDVLVAQAANPKANFSIMTPFSVLTTDEFTKNVLNQHIRPNRTKTSAPATTTTSQKRSLRQQDATTFSSMQSMIDSLMKSLQDQAGGSWTVGTVMPATDTTANDADHAGTNEQWHWTQPSQAPIPVTAAPIPVTQAPIPVTAAPTPAPIPVTAAPIPVTQAPIPVTAAPTPTTRAPVVEPVTTQPKIPVQTTQGTSSASYTVDWSATPCMSPVQSQGQCGSCWAFASIAAVESLQCIKNGQSGINKYSEQQLVGCDSQNQGCGGGAPVYAFEYIQENGLCMEDAYPYTLGSGDSVGCSASCSKSQTGITGYEHLEEGEAELLEALKSQPVVAAVASGNAAWKQYVGGIMSSCETTELDHAVLIVGYDDSTFKVRNSWGENWGEEGYVRIERSSSSTGTCGLLSDMSRPKM